MITIRRRRKIVKLVILLSFLAFFANSIFDLIFNGQSFVTPKRQSIYDTPRISKSFGTLSASRNEKADVLKEAILKHYVAKMQQKLLDNDPNLKYLAYLCIAKHGDLCGGFGDRTRGVLSGLYLAIATDRLFIIQWETADGTKLDDIFNVNAKMYGVSEKLFQAKVQQMLSSPMPFFSFNGPMKERHLVNLTSDLNLFENVNQNVFLGMTFNTMGAIEGLLKNPTLTEKWNLLLSEIDRHEAIDMSVFVAAGERLIFGRPKERLERTFIEEISDQVSTWRRSPRLGVQIRQLRSDWGDFRYSEPRIMQNDYACIVETVKRQLLDMAETSEQNVVLFVTGDSAEAIDYVVQQINKCCHAFVDIVTTNSLSIGHLEAGLELPTSIEAATNSWRTIARTYVDWLALTRMHRLVISRSGFGETASYYSLVPTLRIDHKLTDEQRCVVRAFNVIGPEINIE